jgi:hypothetical protein
LKKVGSALVSRLLLLLLLLLLMLPLLLRNKSK